MKYTHVISSPWKIHIYITIITPHTSSSLKFSSNTKQYTHWRLINSTSSSSNIYGKLLLKLNVFLNVFFSVHKNVSALSFLIVRFLLSNYL